MEYVQDTVLLKQKKQPVLDIIGFFFTNISYLSLCCAYVFFYLYFGSNFVVTVMVLNATFNTISVI
jgi:hypothetical protein